MNRILPDYLHDEVVKVRRDLHKIPETAFKEIKTSEYIKNYLILNNIKFQSGIAKTGIVVEVVGEKKGENVLGLRADLRERDASKHACQETTSDLGARSEGFGFG